jgi:hypothetical protein
MLPRSWKDNLRRLRASDTTLTELSLMYTPTGDDPGLLRELGGALVDNSLI